MCVSDRCEHVGALSVKGVRLAIEGADVGTTRQGTGAWAVQLGAAPAALFTGTIRRSIFNKMAQTDCGLV